MRILAALRALTAPDMSDLVPGFADITKSALAIAGALYATLSFLHLLQPADWAVAMSATAGATAVLLLVSRAGFVWRRAPDALRRRAMFAIVFAAWVNSALHLWLAGDPMQATNLAVVLLVAGIVLIHRVEYFASVVLCWGAWLVHVALSPEAGAVVHYGVHMLEVTVLASAAFVWKRIVLVRNNDLIKRESTAREDAEAHLRRATAADALFQRSVAEQRERERAETARLAVTTALLESIRQAQSTFIASGNPRVIFESLLENLLKITGSAYGFIGDLLRRDDGTPYLKTRAITDISWNDETRALYGKFRETGLEFTNFKTLFGAAILTAEPVIANEPKTDTRRGGLPPGHPPLNAFLGLPLTAGGEVIGMIGIANREGGYDKELVTLLAPFLLSCANLILACRAESAKQSAHAIVRENEERFRMLFALAPVGIALNRMEDGRFLSGNAALFDMVGYSEEEFARLTYWDITPREYDAAEAEQLQSLRTHGRYGPYEKEYIHKDGTRLPVLLNGRRLSDGPGQEVILSVVQDISARKSFEAKLADARDAAQAANVAKSRFIATMSHELRTPLNAILGFSEIIGNETFGPAGNAQYVEYAHIIRQSGAHLLSLINDVLDLSKIEAGKMELHLEANDVAEVVAEALRLAGARHGEMRGPEPRADVAPALPALLADRRALLQMIVNLVSNARKFTPPDGAITVTAQTNVAGGIVITVADTGIGIAREDIVKALAPFTQIDDGAARRQGGTGLGLPIVKSLIELHGGELALDSDVGRGTRVSLTFPPKADSAKAA